MSVVAHVTPMTSKSSGLAAQEPETSETVVTPTAAMAAQTVSFCAPAWAGWSDIASIQSSCSLSVFIFLLFPFTRRDQNNSVWP